MMEGNPKLQVTVAAFIVSSNEQSLTVAYSAAYHTQHYGTTP